MKSENWVGLFLDLLKIVAPILLVKHGVEVDFETVALGSAAAIGFLGDNKIDRNKG